MLKLETYARKSPQISPPLLPAPPFTSPVEVEGKLYIAQETFGTANKQMLGTLRL